MSGVKIHYALARGIMRRLKEKSSRHTKISLKIINILIVFVRGYVKTLKKHT